MSGRNLRVRAFVGFQLQSAFHTEPKLASLLGKAGARLEDRGITLTISFGRFPAGDLLWPAVVEAIRHSDVAIFDISENNPNVLIEVGLAGGYQKRLLLLKNAGSTSTHPKPSDIGHIYISYPSAERMDDDAVAAELERGVLTFLTSQSDPDRYPKDIWGFDDFDDVMVACTELDDPEKLQHPEPWEFIYLSKYGDLDALFEVETTVHELFPNAHVEHRTGNEILRARVPTTYSGNLVIIGGPDYNALAKHFEKTCPIEYSPAGPDNNIALKVKATGETLTPAKPRGEEDHVVDYGFFVKMANPYSPEKKLVMVGGAHTYGVYGAVKAFSFSRRIGDPVARQNCREVVSQLGPNPDFLSIVEVHGIGSSIPTPRLDKTRLWPLGSAP